MLEMFLKRMKKSKNQKGFTLVELIVVIAILGILAALAVGRFGGITSNAKVKSDRATAATIASAAYSYASEAGVSPSDETVTVEKLQTEGLLEGTGGIKAQSSSNNFVIESAGTADKDKENIKVTAGEDTFYPIDPKTKSE